MTGVSAAEWHLPTRCTPWTVSELLAHIEVVIAWFPGMLAASAPIRAEVSAVEYYRPDDRFAPDTNAARIALAQDHAAEQLGGAALAEDFNTCAPAGRSGPVVVGSVEYGPMTSGTPLIVVLGHQRCGAVKAAYEAMRDGKKLPGNLQAISDALRPAYRETTRGKHADPVDAMVRIHAEQTAAELRTNRDLAPLVKIGRPGRRQRLLLARHRPRGSPHRRALRLIRRDNVDRAGKTFHARSRYTCGAREGHRRAWSHGLRQ